MKSSDFAANYPPLAAIPPEQDGSHFADAQRWSALFGGHLHQILSGQQPEALAVDNYHDWLYGDYVSLETRLFTKRGSPEVMVRAAQKLNELNFHAHNQCLLPLWLTSHLGDSDPQHLDARRLSIVLAQGNLAVRALDMYKYRETLIKSGEYYSEGFSPLQRTIQGRLTEFDAAQTILNYIKRSRPEQNLYAAPAQFEHGQESRNNIDFIINNPKDEQAVGIQVKTNVHSHTYERYDEEKVVLIDGRIDLGGQRYIKAPGDKHPKLRAWGGMVAVSHFLEMTKQERKLYSDCIYADEKYLLGKVLHARSLLAGIRSNNQSAATLIGSRIEHYFDQQQVA